MGTVSKVAVVAGKRVLMGSPDDCSGCLNPASFAAGAGGKGGCESGSIDENARGNRGERRVVRPSEINSRSSECTSRPNHKVEEASIASRLKFESPGMFYGGCKSWGKEQQLCASFAREFLAVLLEELQLSLEWLTKGI